VTNSKPEEGWGKVRNSKWQIASQKRREKVRNSKWQIACQKRGGEKLGIASGK